MADWSVVVVDQAGSSFGTLSDPTVKRLSWELNGFGTAEISLATTDPTAALMVPGREIQIFYGAGTDPIWWGPIIRPQAGLDETTWRCAGILWYFAHRFMGKADRTNVLTNGDFESGETGWTFSGVTHSVEAGEFVEGGHSLKLTGATTDHNTYATQTYTHPAGGYPGGDWLTASAWVKIPSADYVAGAVENRGLLLARRDPAGNVVDVQPANTGFTDATGDIGDDTVKDAWIPLEVLITHVVEGDTVEVRLYPPHGVAYYDLVTLTYMESLSFVLPAREVTTIIEGIVAYAQDRFPGFTHGKSDLHVDWAGADTGTTKSIAYQFAEHRNILDAILEYVRQGVCDISVEVTATTRTFTVWPKSVDTRTPQFGKGTAYPTTLELDVNLADFTFAKDLEQGASSMVLLGPGDGPDRPEGNAVDTSLLGGAFTLELVEQAPDTVTVGQLDERAAERLAVAARPEILEVTTLPGAGIIGDLVEGDTAHVVISYGWVDIDATYRVVRIEVADLATDQATITLNPVTG